MRDFGRLAQRCFNVPLMIEPMKAEIICGALMQHLGIANFTRLDGATLEASELRQRAEDAMDGDRPRTRYYELVNGTAFIPVEGTLMQKVAGLDPWSGQCGYNQIERKLNEAMGDPNVRRILLEIDSPGGEVSGCFALADKLFQMTARNGGKPIYAYANEMACSAAYALACVCDKVYMPETGVVGSVGVWVLLAEMTQRLKADGIKVTLRRAGDRKARGGAYEEWDDQALDKIDGWIENTRLIFANVVAQGRDMSVDAVLATEGNWYDGDEALKSGFIDGIGPREAVIAALELENQ